MAIMTFLESYDFSGKRVIPFCTSGSSSPQTSFNRIKNTVPNAEVLSGFWTPGDNADNSAQAVKNWLDSRDLNISEQTEATTAEITTEKTEPTTAEITTVKTEPTTAKTAATTNKAETTDKQTETTTARAHTSGGGSGGGGGGSSSAAKTTTETSTEATTYTNTAMEKSVGPTTNTKTSSNEVRVSIGSKTISISGRSYEIDAAPYIQSRSNSTLVPLRFAAVAISGGSVNNADESAIISWDASTKTASVHANGSVISFSAGSELMYKNNSPIVMENGVKAEIKDGRMFIPFRALGTALGVKVEWIAETKTAVYKTA